MNHDYTPKEIADATVQASYQHPELRGLDIPPVKAILDALPEPVDGTPPTRVSSQRVTGRFPYTGINFVRDGTPIRADLNNRTGTGRNVNKGRSSGPHLQWVKNTTGKVEDIITREEWDKANPPLSQPKKSFFDHMIDAFKTPFKPQPKRQPITKLRRIWRGPNPITGQTFSTWYWQCALCDHNMKPRETGDTHYGELCFTWEQAQRRATRHAHNHH